MGKFTRYLFSLGTQTQENFGDEMKNMALEA